MQGLKTETFHLIWLSWRRFTENNEQQSQSAKFKGAFAKFWLKFTPHLSDSYWVKIFTTMSSVAVFRVELNSSQCWGTSLCCRWSAQRVVRGSLWGTAARDEPPPAVQAPLESHRKACGAQYGRIPVWSSLLKVSEDFKLWLFCCISRLRHINA